jgi:hypothetical protein
VHVGAIVSRFRVSRSAFCVRGFRFAFCVPRSVGVPPSGRFTSSARRDRRFALPRFTFGVPRSSVRVRVLRSGGVLRSGYSLQCTAGPPFRVAAFRVRRPAFGRFAFAFCVLRSGGVLRSGYSLQCTAGPAFRVAAFHVRRPAFGRFAVAFCVRAAFFVRAIRFSERRGRRFALPRLMFAFGDPRSRRVPRWSAGPFFDFRGRRFSSFPTVEGPALATLCRRRASRAAARDDGASDGDA